MDSSVISANVPSVYFRYFDIVFDRGEGSYLYDHSGRRWLDYTSGVAVTNTGHAHPHVVRSVQDQAAKLLHCQLNVGLHEPAIRLMERVSGLIGPEYSCFLGNTGSEAVEGALKLARLVTGRPAFMAFEGSFHGRTFGALSVTSSKVGWRAGYEPLLSSVFFAPYCYPLRSPHCSPGECNLGCVRRLEMLFRSMVDPKQVAAMIVEPILGEGGYVVPSPGFLPALRRICDEHGIILILDEIQTGYGRTGEMFAFQHTQIEPDIVVLSKGIASGLPVSAIVAKRSLMEQWGPGAHGGTYNGNIVACAAGNATLDVFEDEQLVARSASLGEHLAEELHRAVGEDPGVAEIRGKGLMIGVEFVKKDQEPDSERVRNVRERCFNSGLLLLSAGTFGNVVRFIPPLVTSREEIAEAVAIFSDALKATAA
jgi:4-aminobutyrate aminotransferase